jgi:hypothetical protein
MEVAIVVDSNGAAWENPLVSAFNEDPATVKTGACMFRKDEGILQSLCDVYIECSPLNMISLLMMEPPTQLPRLVWRVEQCHR